MAATKKARDIFLEALSSAPADRAAYLDEACGDDAALRQRVEALLRADDEPGAFLSEARPGMSDDGTGTFPPPADPAEVTASFPGKDEHVGAILAGKYKLVEEIGEGGMGSVFMARQTTPVKRAVAVKVIKAGMDSKAVLARFEAERQALAMMDHPNIAKVLDAGTTEGGRPFFVMELVKGVPITRYCDERKLTPRQRLELFVPVCLAIQHAHQKGIIHRDIKPNNVLVALYDDKPVPKVIDFGVAKAAGPALTDKTLMTGFGAVVGTPEYMSPEQANLNNLDIDTRSDVYSLGVLLYELLTGSTPVDRKSLGQAALLEILRIVREVEAPKPSHKLSTSDALPSVAACRGTEPAKLSMLMKGELDWVVLKALEKDRTRRYDTANGLARDIQRYLADEVVEARPPSTGYRLQKFVRRHKGQVIAASLVLLALVCGVVGTTWGLIRADLARAAEAKRVTERDAALIQADDNARKADANARTADAYATKAEAEAVAARKAEAEAKERARAEAEAKGVAQGEKERADSEKRRAEEQLDRAERLVYVGKLALAQSEFAEGNGWAALQYLEECPWNLRGWEHRHLWTRFNAKQTLLGHTDIVTSVSWSPDGKRILTGSYDNTAKVWDAETGQEVISLKGHTHIVTSVSWSPDGKRILTGSWDSKAKVWDAETGHEVLSLKGHTNLVSSVSWSPDGKRILTGSYDNTAKIWDADKGQEILNLKGHTGGVWSVSWSPDGKRILTGSYDSTAKVWDAETGQEIFSLKGHTEQVSSVSWSPDGKHILTGSWDNTAKVWDAETGQEVLSLKRYKQQVTSVSWSPDGKRILTGSGEYRKPGEAKVWDAETGQEILSLKGHTGWVTSVTWSPDGKRILTGSGDNTAKVWDAETGQEVISLKGHTDIVTSVTWSPDGKRILTGSWDNTAKVWDTDKGQAILNLKGHTWRVTSVSWSPDGKRILTGSGDKTAKVWDAETGQEILSLKGHTNDITSVTWSPDGKRILTGSGDNTAKVWDAGTGQEVLSLKRHTSQVTSVSWSPDGKHILTGCWDSTAKVWDAETGQEILSLKGHTGWVTSVSWSPDGKRILTGSGDPLKPGIPGEAKVWDAETGQEILNLKGHTDIVTSVSWSPDGKRILTGSWDNTAKVWDADKGQAILNLKGHTWRVTSVSWSPDGKRILTGSGDKTAKVWDTGKGQAILNLKGHTHIVTSVSWSPDGKRILTGSWDNTAKVWDAETGQEVLSLRGHTDIVLSVSWSPDGKRILTGSYDNTAKVWDAETGQEVLSLKGHTEQVSSVSWSPDGQRIFAWDATGKVLAWDSGTGQRADTANAPPRPGPSLARSPDNSRLALMNGSTIALIDTALHERQNLWPLTNAAERRRYHMDQVALAEKDKQWFAVAFHLQRLRLDAPDDVDLKQRRDVALRKHNEPTPGAGRRINLRYKAACAAALAGAENEPLDDAAKAKLRGQALDLLKAELAWHRQQLESDKPADPVAVQGALLAWQKDGDLAGIRDAAALARLPGGEQKAFAQFWADVATLVQKAEEKSKQRR